MVFIGDERVVLVDAPENNPTLRLEQAGLNFNDLTDIIATHFHLFLNPNEQLARALAEGLKKIAARKPLIVFNDTYEIVDRADIWLREVMRAAGPRLVWVMSGHDDLRRSRKFDGDLEHELRVIEELHYHSINDSRYIAEIRQALVEQGIMDENEVTKELKLKETSCPLDTAKHENVL